MFNLDTLLQNHIVERFRKKGIKVIDDEKSIEEYLFPQQTNSEYKNAIAKGLYFALSNYYRFIKDDKVLKSIVNRELFSGVGEIDQYGVFYILTAKISVRDLLSDKKGEIDIGNGGYDREKSVVVMKSNRDKEGKIIITEIIEIDKYPSPEKYKNSIELSYSKKSKSISIKEFETDYKSLSEIRTCYDTNSTCNLRTIDIKKFSIKDLEEIIKNLLDNIHKKRNPIFFRKVLKSINKLILMINSFRIYPESIRNTITNLEDPLEFWI